MAAVAVCLELNRQAVSCDLTADTRGVHIGTVTKKLIQHGNSAALVFDKA
jgi:hypothetical protein